MTEKKRVRMALCLPTLVTIEVSRRDDGEVEVHRVERFSTQQEISARYLFQSFTEDDFDELDRLAAEALGSDD